MAAAATPTSRFRRWRLADAAGCRGDALADRRGGPPVPATGASLADCTWARRPSAECESIFAFEAVATNGYAVAAARILPTGADR
jgi:hypothetical protein